MEAEFAGVDDDSRNLGALASWREKQDEEGFSQRRKEYGNSVTKRRGRKD